MFTTDKTFLLIFRFSSSTKALVKILGFAQLPNCALWSGLGKVFGCVFQISLRVAITRYCGRVYCVIELRYSIHIIWSVKADPSPMGNH